MKTSPFGAGLPSEDISSGEADAILWTAVHDEWVDSPGGPILSTATRKVAKAETRLASLDHIPSGIQPGSHGPEWPCPAGSGASLLMKGVR